LREITSHRAHSKGFRINKTVPTGISRAQSHDRHCTGFPHHARAWSFSPYAKEKTSRHERERLLFFFFFFCFIQRQWEEGTPRQRRRPKTGRHQQQDWEPVSAMKSVHVDFEVERCSFKRFGLWRGCRRGTGDGSASISRCMTLLQDIGVSTMAHRP